MVFLGLFRDVTLEEEMERFICNHVLSKYHFGSLITCDSILRHYCHDLVLKTVCFDLVTGTFHVELETQKYQYVDFLGCKHHG